MAELSVIHAAIRQRYEWPSGRALYACCAVGPVCLGCLRFKHRGLQADPTLTIEAASPGTRCSQCQKVIE